MNKQARKEEDGSVASSSSDPNERFFKGTPQYLAPEILLGLPHDQAVDWWAFGVMVFEFVNGYKPFDGDSPEQIFREVLSGNIRWPPPEHDDMSASCKNLVVRLLDNDAQSRLASAVRVKAHPWFADVDWLALSSDVPPMIPQETMVGEEDTSAFHEREAFFPMPAADEDLTYLMDGGPERDLSDDDDDNDDGDAEGDSEKPQNLSFSNFWHVSLANLAQSGLMKKK